MYEILTPEARQALLFLNEGIRKHAEAFVAAFSAEYKNSALPAVAASPPTPDVYIYNNSVGESNKLLAEILVELKDISGTLRRIEELD